MAKRLPGHGRGRQGGCGRKGLRRSPFREAVRPKGHIRAHPWSACHHRRSKTTERRPPRLSPDANDPRSKSLACSRDLLFRTLGRRFRQRHSDRLSTIGTDIDQRGGFPGILGHTVEKHVKFAAGADDLALIHPNTEVRLARRARYTFDRSRWSSANHAKRSVSTQAGQRLLDTLQKHRRRLRKRHPPRQSSAQCETAKRLGGTDATKS